MIVVRPRCSMDPHSRRATWRLLMRAKRGRVVLLTTHAMDEADTLADRIAIMADGRLRAVGSSLWLKSAPALRRAACCTLPPPHSRSLFSLSAG